MTDGTAYYRARSRRARETRSVTISCKRLSKAELDADRHAYPEPSQPLPEGREACVGGPRPCPMVRCRYHLAIDVSPKTGAIKLNFPDLEIWEMPETCALDVADRNPDGMPLEDVGKYVNLTRERVRQYGHPTIAKIRSAYPELAGAFDGAEDHGMSWPESVEGADSTHLDTSVTALAPLSVLRTARK